MFQLLAFGKHRIKHKVVLKDYQCLTLLFLHFFLSLQLREKNIKSCNFIVITYFKSVLHCME